MKKKYISMVLMAALAAGTLSGCGDKSSGTSGDKNSSTQKDSSESSKGGDNATAEGKVINVYSWNDEFMKRVTAVYPEVKETSSL